ncbi:MAG: hypothetical protein QOE90_2153 [Thermoplasmata archaeon]|jgi:hypothetical protein|nr:hypothetical protein [Thermoplasmata archaeon]
MIRTLPFALAVLLAVPLAAPPAAAQTECTRTDVAVDGATFLSIYGGPLCPAHVVVYLCHARYMGGGGTALDDLTWDCVALTTLYA